MRFEAGLGGSQHRFAWRNTLSLKLRAHPERSSVMIAMSQDKERKKKERDHFFSSIGSSLAAILLLHSPFVCDSVLA